MDIHFNSRQTIELLKTGAKYLEARGISDARAEADLLLAFVLGTTRDKLYLESDRAVTPEACKHYQDFLCRRGDREPLAYLFKTREFMGLEFYVDPNVLIPRPETELLAEKALAILKNSRTAGTLHVLDLCTGSGALAIAIACYTPDVKVWAVDISQAALGVAKKNARRNKAEIAFRLGDLFEPAAGEKFDLIVSNPPYVSEAEYDSCSPEVKREPPTALLGGKDGLDFYRRIAREVGNFLVPQGTLLLEIGCRQGSVVAALLAASGFKTDILPDYAGLDRIVVAQRE
jgi:release factor glutamine methyltransferase